MGRIRKASPDKTERLCATDAAKLYKQGLQLCGEQSYGKALPLFDFAIRSRTDCPHYFAARANCKQALGHYVDAYHDYVSAICLNRTKSTYFSCRGLCLMKIGKAEAALSDFSKACELEPTAAVYHYQKASLLHHHLIRPGDAVESYGDCLANVGPSDGAMTLRSLHARGACLFEEGRATEAVTDLSRAVEISDASPAAMHYLAKALKAIGEEDRALKTLTDALDKAASMSIAGGKSAGVDGSHEMYFDRGVLRLERGDDEGALSDFDQAVATSGTARGAYFVQRARARARVALKSQGHEEALAGVEDIEKAMQLEPENPEFLFTAGMLCSRLGEYERALGHLKRLLLYFDRQDKEAFMPQPKTGIPGYKQSPGNGGGSVQGYDGKPITPREKARMDSALADPATCKFETAICLYKLGHPLEALPLAEAALASSCTEDARRFQLRGLVLHDLRHYADAVKDFTASIAFDNRSPEAFLLRGRSFAGLARHERAVGDFTSALNLLSDAKSHENDLVQKTTDDTIDQETRRHDEEGGGDDIERPRVDGQEKNLTPDYGDNALVQEVGSLENNNENLKENSTDKTPKSLSASPTNMPTDQKPKKRSRRVSTNSADGGDGMGEGGSVIGACHYARALSLQQLKKHQGAVEDFNRAIEEGPINWQRLWHRATCLAELGETWKASAERDLRRCRILAEEEGVSMLGLASLRLRDHSTALGHFNNAAQYLALNPPPRRRPWPGHACILPPGYQQTGAERKRSPAYDNGLNRPCSKEDRFDARRGGGRAQLRGKGGGDGKRVSSGEVSWGIGNGDGASSVIADDVFEASLHYHRALCLTYAGELEEAEEAFSMAIEDANRGAKYSNATNNQRVCSDELRTALYRERGKTRQLLRDFVGARNDFTACLKESSTTTTATAESASESSRHHDKGEARTLFGRGWANKALGDLQAAATDLESARLLEPKHSYLTVDYRNIFDTELIVIDDVEPFTESPAIFHSW